MYDIIIVGAGTAGLSAAIYGVRAGKSVLLLESAMYGGQIVNSFEIENYPGIKRATGTRFADDLYDQAISLGAVLKYEKVTGIKVHVDFKAIITGQQEYQCKSLILATGARNRPLGLKREQAMIGRGVSYCAACDGAFFKEKDVAVVGGGNTALEDAKVLAAYCRKVYVIHRRDMFRGEEHVLKFLQEKENVVFITNSEVVELLGEDKLAGLQVKNKESNTVKEIQVNGLFIAIGQMPDNQAFADVIDLDKGGYIKALEDCKTNVAGIFAAGDCRTKAVRQLATAAADGAVAGLAAAEFTL